MRFLATLFRNLSRHGAVERDLDEEVRAHLELLVDEYRATGMEDAAARRAARLELGGIGQVKDAVRDVRRGIWLEHGWQDVRYALRIFRRSPGFAATAVVSLAVGIAGATGLFSIVHAALLNPFPFFDSHRIVEIGVLDKGKPRELVITGRQLVALQESEVLDGAFVSNSWDMTLTGARRPGSGAHPVSFSERSDRTRGSASPRTRLHRGGRAGGRATPAGRRAHLSLLAATLRRAARGQWGRPST